MTRPKRSRKRKKAGTALGQRTVAEAHPVFAATAAIDDRLVAAYHQISAKYGHRPEVTGVDIGLQRKGGKETGALAVRIHVREKFDKKHLSSREVFPTKLDGVPVDVIEAYYVRHAGPGGARFQTLQPGISVGHPRDGSGTLGLFVTNAAGEPCFLSAAHVLVPDNFSNAGDPITQPGRPDGGRVPDDTVARVGVFDFWTDSAVAVLTGGRPTSAQIFGTTTTLTGLRAPAIGDILSIAGRDTNPALAKVDGVNGPYGGVESSFRLVPAGPTQELICDFGDSGAIWFDPNTSEGVGLHCLGAANPTPSHQFAVASMLSAVLAALNVTF